MAFDQHFINGRIERAAGVIASLKHRSADIERAAVALVDALQRGGTVYTCGNGGSAAEALHLTEELIGRYSKQRPPMRGVCLNADPTAITCIANDFGYDEIFARQAQALIRPGDVLVAFSTSGKSPNIVRALTAAKRAGGKTIALLGKGGGEAAHHADHALIVDSDATEHIQEAHQVILHLFLEAAERIGAV